MDSFVILREAETKLDEFPGAETCVKSKDMGVTKDFLDLNKPLIRTLSFVSP